MEADRELEPIFRGAEKDLQVVAKKHGFDLHLIDDSKGTWYFYPTITTEQLNEKEEPKPMTEYQTRPIDFTGCHPVVAEHLKRGVSVKCKVWDDSNEEPDEMWVESFDTGDFPYFTKTEDRKEYCWYRCAEPLPKTTYYWKKASEIFKWCEDNGCVVDIEGRWHKDGKTVFYACWLHFCGKEATDDQREGKPTEWFEEK